MDLTDGPSPSEAELILAKELPKEIIDKSDGAPGIDEDDNDQRGSKLAEDIYEQFSNNIIISCI